MQDSSFKKAIALVDSGTRYPVMDLVRQDPGMAAVLSKLTQGAQQPSYDNSGNRETVTPNMQGFRQISQQTAEKSTEAQTVMQMLPDTELAAQILLSSILSPKDMADTELTHTVTEGLMAPEVSAAMIARMRQHFEQDYKIKPLLPKMLRDVLFETGSYAVATLPENSIDDAINSVSAMSMESFKEALNSDGTIRPLGLLGPVVVAKPRVETLRPGIALESFDTFKPDTSVDGAVTFEGQFSHPVTDSFLTVSDNYNLLKIPRIQHRLREQKIMQVAGSRAMESVTVSRVNDRVLTKALYKNRPFSHHNITNIKTQEQLSRSTVGNPLVLHLPSESVIPVYIPGNVDQQVGFYVLLDGDGNPVRKDPNPDYYQELSSRLSATSGGQTFASAMVGKVKGLMSGFNLGNNRHLDFSARTYGEMVEKDLLARLRNGVYGNGVAIAKKEEIYRIMFSRALAKQHTQALFIPVELMTYIALRYNENGIGKSLLDDMSIINGLRTTLMFANVQAALKNSTARTEVKLKLDPSDPNPQKTIELAIHEIVSGGQQVFPLGTNSPVDIVNFLQRARYEFTYEGHPGLPDMAIDFGEKASNYVKPDTELENELRKRSIMSMGVSPETVDNSFNSEFAESIVTNNILLAKRVTQIQGQFMPLVTNHMRQVARSSEGLLSDLRDILESNYDRLKPTVKEEDEARTKAALLKKNDPAGVQAVDAVLEKQVLISKYLEIFIANYEVFLPRPNSVTLENQLTALETYKKALKETLAAWISSDFFTENMGGEVANEVGTITAVLEAYFVRQWMAENGMMTELSGLTTKDSDGKPMIDIYGMQVDHLASLTATLTKFMVKLQPAKDASNTELAAVGAEVSDTPTVGADDGGQSDTGGGGGGSDDTFDFDGGPSLDDEVPATPENTPADSEQQESVEESSSSTSTKTEEDGSTSTSSSSTSSSSSTTTD